MPARRWLVAAFSKQAKGPLTEFAGGRAGQGAVEAVDLGERPHVLGAVETRKGPGWLSAPVANLAGLDELGDQPGQLRVRQAGDLGQIPP